MTYTRLNPQLSYRQVEKSETYTCPANGGVAVLVSFTPPSGGGWVLASFSITALGMGQEGYVRSFNLEPQNNRVYIYLHNTSSSAATDKTITARGNFVKAS